MALQDIIDVIEIILNGSTEDKKGLQRHFFKVSDTGDLLKKYGLITHHNSKDSDHNLSAED